LHLIFGIFGIFQTVCERLVASIVHNVTRKYVGNYEQGCDCDSEMSNCVSAILRQGGNSTDISVQIRAKFKDFFCSSEGRVEWRDCILNVTHSICQKLVHHLMFFT
jgi:hypothetical protein